MTNFEFLRSKFPEFLLDSSIIRNNLAIQEVDAEAPYSKNVPYMELDLAYVSCLEYILRLPASVSQGGFSLSLSDKEIYKAELKSIYSKWDKSEELSLFLNKPDITNAGEWR